MMPPRKASPPSRVRVPHWCAICACWPRTLLAAGGHLRVSRSQYALPQSTAHRGVPGMQPCL